MATGTVLEAAMVMVWMVALVLGERAVARATDARRSAEDAAEQSASESSGSYCSGKSASVRSAHSNPSIMAGGKPDVQAAISAIAGLGLGGQRTFPYYLLPLQKVGVTASATADEREFVANRNLGCLERPLDVPQGTLGIYRMILWLTNLKGY
jgi:hypothetical protein